MTSFYAKEGRTSRIEIERGHLRRLELSERGEATEHGNRFECRTLAGGAEEIDHTVRPPEELIQSIVAMGDRCERATLLAGSAHHLCRDAEGERQWSDEITRIHVSLVNRRLELRCELERGGTTFDPSWIDEIRLLSDALERAGAGSVAESLILEPGATAPILAQLASHQPPDPIALHQQPREGEIDGKGRRLRPCRLNSTESDAIGWYRPSYRFRPRRLAHGVDLFDPAGIVEETPTARAIACLGHPEISRESVTATCLVVREDGTSFPHELKIPFANWANQIVVSDEGKRWLPLLAGVWGRRLAVVSVA